WVAVLAHLKGIKSAPQHAVAVEQATWVGEPIAAVVADSRAAAEDGLSAIEAELDPLPVVVDMRTALDAATPLIHPALGDNLTFQRLHEKREIEATFASAHKVIEARFKTGRHTGVCLEPRSILADYSRSEGQLTVYNSTKAPHMMQTVF